LTQGSQSLALGLTLAAAPQLVEGSRLTRHDHGLLSCASPPSSMSLPFQRFLGWLVG